MNASDLFIVINLYIQKIYLINENKQEIFRNVMNFMQLK